MPRVSVVVPAYNSVDFIEQAIDSILAQTYDDYELIVSDHSSSDGTTKILEAYAERGVLTLHHLPRGGGAPANWRAVTAHASGEYFKLVCGDDLLAPSALAAQVEALDAHPSAVMAASQRDLIDARGRQLVAARGLGGLQGCVPGAVAARRSVLKGANIFGEPGCVLFRREAFEAAGAWSDDHPFVIDQHSYCRTVMQGNFVAVAGQQASFRVSSGQWSVDLSKAQSDQVVAMHHSLAEEFPGLLSRRDLAIGDARARNMAHVRRLTYFVLGPRMRAAETAKQSKG